MKGGARQGAGRKRGQKDVRPRKGTAARAESDKIKAMLAMDVKAKAKFYQEFLVRTANQDGKQKPLSLAEKKLMGQLFIELEAEADGKNGKAEQLNLDAGDFLRVVWNDPQMDPALRIRAAEIVYRGPGEGKGKKDEKADKAKEAGKGKFAPAPAPQLVVNK